jgi:pectate lyase
MRNKLALTLAGTVFGAVLFVQSPALVASSFPGAEGFGTDTPGGRGGVVYEVTTLNDSGPGSLRACVDASGPRICVFRTGGMVELRSALVVSNPYITIAGQTASGGGIALRNTPSVSSGSPSLYIKTHDIIVRYLSFRPGPGALNASDGDATLIANNKSPSVYNIVIDHCSFSWAIDEVLSTWYDSHDITIQWSIVAEGLDCSTHEKGCHSKGALLGGYANGAGDGAYAAKNISFHHNLMAHNGERNPMIKTGGLVDVVNNVSYDPYWVFSYVYMRSQSPVTANYVANYFKYGPSSDRNKYEIKAYDEGGVGAEVYVEGNIGPHRASCSEAEDLAVDPSLRAVSEPGTVDPNTKAHLVTRRFPAPPVTTYVAFDTTKGTDAYREVLAEAGNSQGLSAVGEFYMRRDAVDKRIVEEVRRGEGRIIDAPGSSSCLGACRGMSYILSAGDYTKYGISDPLDADGWPVLAAGSPTADSDHDGMPDNWEILHGLNPNDASDANLDPDGDGYSNLEEYLNGTDPSSASGNTRPAPPTGLHKLNG